MGGYGESPRVSVGDFGAGGARYSEWLNETGLVEAFAFDGVQSVADISGGNVLEVDLASSFELWRTFNWVICLDVGQHMPRTSVQTLLQNLRRHLEAGLVISWASSSTVPATESKSASAVSTLEEAELNALVERETGLHLDIAATTSVREG